MVAEYHNQSKLRFWCQMVLPLVYDDSLSYMELLNKVVNYLNNCIQDVGNCETNIELLLDAFESLQDYVNEMVEDISPEIESVIDQMIENGDFTEILTDALNTVVAPEYDEETTYLQYEYVLYEGNLYRANTTTSGEFDPTKWTEKTIAQDLTVLERYVYGLTANDVPYDGTQTYDAGSTGKAIKDLAAEVDSLDAGDIAYNSSTTYNNATVGKELGDLKGAITQTNNIISVYVENENTASQGYSRGQYIIWKGNFYRVISPISSGGTFTVNTNIVSASVGGELTPQFLTKQNIANSYFDWTQSYNTIEMARVGNIYIVKIRIAPSSEIPAQTSDFNIASFGLTTPLSFGSTYVVAPSQYGEAYAPLVFQVSQYGTIVVANNHQTKTASGFYMANFALI